MKQSSKERSGKISSNEGSEKKTIDDRNVDDDQGTALSVVSRRFPNEPLSSRALLEMGVGALQSAAMHLGALSSSSNQRNANECLGEDSTRAGLLHLMIGAEERQKQQLLSQILLQQQQQQQQQQVLLAAAVESSGLASLVPSSFSFGNVQLATLRNALATRAQLEEAHAQLTLQQNRLRNDSYSDVQSPAMATRLLAQHDNRLADSTASSESDHKLPYFDASTMPDPSSDEDSDQDDEYQGRDPFAPEKFPFKLYRMLEEADQSIVSFLPHGRAFAIHKPREFVAELMPKYFSTTRLTSFQRQLNLYAFRRITEGRDKGGYFHEYFLRGRKRLCKKIRRQKRVPKKAKVCGATEGESSQSIHQSTVAAAPSTDALNQVIQQFIQQDNAIKCFSPSMQRILQPTNLTLRTPTLPFLGLGNAFGGLQPGLGTQSQTGASTEARRMATEIAAAMMFQFNHTNQSQQR